MSAINESIPVHVYEYYRTTINDTRNSPCLVSSSGMPKVLVGYDSKRGQTNPGWRDRIAKGVDASSPYTRRVWSPKAPARISAELSTLGRFEPAYRIDSAGKFQLWGCGSPQFTSDEETYNRALRKIKNQLSSRVGSMNAVVPLVELRELRGLIGQATFLGTNFMLAVLQAKRTYGRSVWKYLTETWLGFSFGLAPLVNDINSAIQAVASYMARSNISSRLTASATKYGQYSYTPVTAITQVPFGALGWKNSGKASYKLSYRFTGAFDVDLVSGESYTPLQHFGATLGQIPATLWELTAFSWMADYFSNIGVFLEDSFSASPGMTKYLVMTRKYSMDWESTFSLVLPTPRNNPNGCVVLNSLGNGVATGHYDEFARTVLANLPHATLYLKSIDSIGRDGITKLLNLISLVNVPGPSGRFIRPDPTNLI